MRKQNLTFDKKRSGVSSLGCVRQHKPLKKGRDVEGVLLGGNTYADLVGRKIDEAEGVLVERLE
jgi:hypothetical protein